MRIFRFGPYAFRKNRRIATRKYAEFIGLGNWKMRAYIDSMRKFSDFILCIFTKIIYAFKKY